MAENSNIEWCDHTFNPWVGCTKVSPGCDHCYAEQRMDTRLHRVKWGAGAPRQRTKTWGDPKRWNDGHDAFFAQHGRRQRVFCASLADVFDNEVPEHWRWDLFRLIAATPNLDWLLLTKRVGNARKMLNEVAAAVAGEFVGAAEWDRHQWPNVWIGATVVDQAEADRDVPKLLATPAAVRFLSVEPMLGPVDLRRLRTPKCVECGDGWHFDALTGRYYVGEAEDLDEVGRYRELHWVICGGESGPKARPMHPDWARSLRDQCQAAGVPFLFKQWGEWKEVCHGKALRPIAIESDIGETLASLCDGFINIAGDFESSMQSAPIGVPYRGMQRIGKKAAGRLLDGRTHDGFPR